jgi:DNA-binding MarR family transcriptional regulator
VIGLSEELKFPNLSELETMLDALDVDPEAILLYNEISRTVREFAVLLESPTETLSIARSSAMWYITNTGHKNGVTPAEIAQALQVTRATVTGLITALEKSGFVTRQQSTNDRRKYYVRPTAAGKRALKLTWPKHAKTVSGAMGVLTRQDITSMVKLTTKLRENLQKHRHERVISTS